MWIYAGILMFFAVLALVGFFLDPKGAPSMVERAKVLFPLSQIGAIDEGQRNQLIKGSKVYGKYDKAVERESAFEVLLAEKEKQLKEAAEEEGKKASGKAAKVPGKKSNGIASKVWKAIITAVTATVATMLGNTVSEAVTGNSSSKKTSTKDKAGKVVKSATSAAARTITREITRTITGTLGR